MNNEAAGPRRIRAYELDSGAADRATSLVTRELRGYGIRESEASKLASSWIRVDDYLLASPSDRHADVVAGNPPYIRYDDLPQGAFDSYRRLYPTMVGRCDIYVGFIEAYCVRMRSGTLRFQAQYLRRIKVPGQASLSEALRSRLREAFRARDADAATAAAIEAYGIADMAGALACSALSSRSA